MRTAKAQTILHICEVSPEHILFAHVSGSPRETSAKNYTYGFAKGTSMRTERLIRRDVRRAFFSRHTSYAFIMSVSSPVSILRKSISGRHRPDVDLRRMLAGSLPLFIFFFNYFSFFLLLFGCLFVCFLFVFVLFFVCCLFFVFLFCFFFFFCQNWF